MSALFLKDINPPASVMISDTVRHLKRQGEKIIALQTGDPDFATPPIVIEEMEKYARGGFTHYADSQGIIELREAVANKCARFNMVTINPDREVQITNGGIHAYYLIMGSLFEAGDEVLIPDPTWTSHMNVAMASGVVPVMVPASLENEYVPHMEDWESRVTARTKALVVNYPSNPTGALPSQEYLKELVQFAARYNLLIISDEVYEHIIYDGYSPSCISALPGAQELTVTIYSFSKSYAMTGWRLGYVTAPPPLLAKIKKLSQYTITNVAPFIQLAGAFVLNSPEVENEVKKMTEVYTRRRQMVKSFLDTQATGLLDYYLPKGAFYFFLNLEKVAASSLEAANDLLVTHKVATVPGVAYGSKGENHLRITIAASEADIEEGMERILQWIRSKVN